MRHIVKLKRRKYNPLRVIMISFTAGVLSVSLFIIGLGLLIGGSALTAIMMMAFVPIMLYSTARYLVTRFK